MPSSLKLIFKALAYVVGVAVALIIATIGACYGDAWLSQREWEASYHRIQPSEVEVYDVRVEPAPDSETDVVFSGKIRNNSKAFILVDVDAQVFFQLRDADGHSEDFNGWGGKALAVGWGLRPGKSAEFKFHPYVGDPRPTPPGGFAARIVVTRVRGVTE